MIKKSSKTVSFKAALEPHFGKPIVEYPAALCEHIKQETDAYDVWDSLSVEQQRDAAHRVDERNAARLEAVRKRPGEEEAKERSRTAAEAYDRTLFEEVYWPLERAVAWIKFRERSVSEEHLRSATLYSTRDVVVPNPGDELVKALQRGNLTANIDERILQPTYWARFDGRRWPKEATVRRDDVLELWRDLTSGTEYRGAVTGTGLPGRPSQTVHLIQDELDRRIAVNGLEDSLKKQAQALFDWVQNKYPQLARPKPRSIGNAIRTKFNGARQAAHN